MNLTRLLLFSVSLGLSIGKKDCTVGKTCYDCSAKMRSYYKCFTHSNCDQRTEECVSGFCCPKKATEVELSLKTDQTLPIKTLGCHENLLRMKRSQAKQYLGTTLNTYRPKCEINGTFWKAKQCVDRRCWCVDKYGEMIGKEFDKNSVVDCYQKRLQYEQNLYGIDTTTARYCSYFKPGKCLLHERMRRPPEPQCNCDVDCPGSKKCCMLPTGRYCSESETSGGYIPVVTSIPRKPGQCPVLTSRTTAYNQCSSDRECYGTRKCCTVPTGRYCSEPETSGGYIAVVTSIPGKPDQCPDFTSWATAYNQCSSDRECSGRQKCCMVPTGRYCSSPETSGGYIAVVTSIPGKPGKCPVFTKRVTAYNQCSRDQECYGSEKCCLNSSGHYQCVLPEVDNGQKYDGFTTRVPNHFNTPSAQPPWRTTKPPGYNNVIVTARRIPYEPILTNNYNKYTTKLPYNYTPRTTKPYVTPYYTTRAPNPSYYNPRTTRYPPYYTKRTTRFVSYYTTRTTRYPPDYTTRTTRYEPYYTTRPTRFQPYDTTRTTSYPPYYPTRATRFVPYYTTRTTRYRPDYTTRTTRYQPSYTTRPTRFQPYDTTRTTRTYYGRLITKGYTGEKVGVCPSRSTINKPKRRCKNDWECLEDQKCCPELFGRFNICEQPEHIQVVTGGNYKIDYTVTPSPFTLNYENTQGTCPTAVTSLGKICYNDYQCETHQKCCPTQYGKICVMPIGRPSPEPDVIRHGTAFLRSRSDQITGKVYFSQQSDGMKITGHIKGLQRSITDLFIYTYGDVEGHCNNIGQPFKTTGRFNGSLGKVNSDYIDLLSKDITFTGPNAIIGRSLAIHSDIPLPKACGVIGIGGPFSDPWFDLPRA